MRFWLLLLLILLLVAGIGYAALKVQNSYERRLEKELEKIEEFNKAISTQCYLRFPHEGINRLKCLSRKLTATATRKGNSPG